MHRRSLVADWRNARSLRIATKKPSRATWRAILCVEIGEPRRTRTFNQLIKSPSWPPSHLRNERLIRPLTAGDCYRVRLFRGYRRGYGDTWPIHFFSSPPPSSAPWTSSEGHVETQVRLWPGLSSICGPRELDGI